MTPKVSIGMPVYNGENFIEEAIETILAQTYQDFELVISDNCSTDSTPRICQGFARDARVRYITQEKNLGAVGNSNALVGLTNGEYFKWAAHDDVMHPTFIERCVELLDENPEVAWCHSRSDMIDAEGRSFLEILPENVEEIECRQDGQRHWVGWPRDHFDSESPSQRFRGVILGTNWCVDTYGLFRRSVLLQTRLLIRCYGAEKVHLAEMSLLGKYKEVPELLFCQRIHDSASSNLNSAAAQSEFSVRSGILAPRFSTRFALLMAHIYTVLCARISPWQKILSLLAVIQYVFQFGKWKRIMSSALSGAGVGGGGARILESAKAATELDNDANLKVGSP